MVDVLAARVVGPLESFAPGFAAELGRQGYTVNSASQHMCFIAHLSRWMLARGGSFCADAGGHCWLPLGPPRCGVRELPVGEGDAAAA
jgi:hypothetical protein